MRHTARKAEYDNVINIPAEPSLFVRAVLHLSMIVSLVVWGIIGFLIYVPMLFRIVAFYCSMVFASSFNGDIYIELAQKKLEYVVRLYPDRFRLIIHSFQNRYHKEETLPRSKPIDWRILLKDAFIDIIWGIIFWTSIYFLLLQIFFNH